MPKAGGSSSGASKIFTTNTIGPPPGPNTVGTAEWIELGTIPTGQSIWFGLAQYASPDKSITFEVRYNNAGQNSGADATTSLLASIAVAPRSGTVTVDYYKNGRLHLVTIPGTGTEKYWLKLKSKSGTAGSYYFSINYTVE